MNDAWRQALDAANARTISQGRDRWLEPQEGQYFCEDCGLEDCSDDCPCSDCHPRSVIAQYENQI